MRRDGTWAGNVEVQAASMALHVNFRIYQPGQPVWTIKNWPPDHVGEASSSPSASQYDDNDNEGGSSSSRKGKSGGKKIKTSSLVEPAKTVHMAYHDGCHYNSVRAANDHGSGHPLPINTVLFDMHKDEDEEEEEEEEEEKGDADGIDNDEKEDSEEDEEPSSPDRNNGKGKKKKSNSSSEASTQPAPPTPSTSQNNRAPGRNRPCPCGSRMKYKNCCGATKRVAAVVSNHDNEKKVDGVTVYLKELRL